MVTIFLYGNYTGWNFKSDTILVHSNCNNNDNDSNIFGQITHIDPAKLSKACVMGSRQRTNFISSTYILNRNL